MNLTNAPPVVIPPPDRTVTATDTLTTVDIGTATATDDVGVVSLTNNAPAAYPLGVTYVTWTASDAAGNIGTAVQTITVGCIPGTFTMGDNILISKTPNGSAGNNASVAPTITGDGRYVAFTSLASNLGPVDTNGNYDIFRYDTQTGAIVTVSIGAGGTQSNGFSHDPAISADGRYISFISWATNLLSYPPFQSPGSTFRYDTQSGTTQFVNASNSNGGPMSDDGRYLVFGSDWALPQGSNHYIQAYLYDFLTGTTELISKGANGILGNGNTVQPSISADGRYVVFSSDASNLVPNDTNGTKDVFVYDRQTRNMERVSIASDGTQGNGISLIGFSGHKFISDDGRYVVFHSWASNLVPGDTNNSRDVFVHDRQTHTTQLMSVNRFGVAANNFSEVPSISGNGRYVTFMSAASDLVQKVRETNTYSASYIRDLATGVTQAVSICANGKICDGGPPAINYDGSVLAFSSNSGTLGSVDTNGWADVYLHRRTAICSANGGGFPPVVTPPPNITVEATGTLTQVDIGTATATDDQGIASITSNAPAAGFPLGTTTVTWIAVDTVGMSGTATQSVTVRDTTPPTLTLPADMIVDSTSTAGAPVTFSATATDIVDPSPVVTCVPASGSVFPLGTTTVTCTARDASNKTTTGHFTITVQDKIPPVLTVPADKTVEASGPLTPVDIGQATATDNLPVTITNNAPAAYPVATTFVTWTAKDANNNSISKDQKIMVQDTIAPVVTPPANMTVQATGAMTSVNIGTATATDAVGVVSLTSNAPAGYPLGTTTVTWTAKDAAGNTGTATQTITIIDTAPPVLHGLNNQVFGATSTAGATASAVTATDNIDPNPSVSCTATSGATFALAQPPLPVPPRTPATTASPEHSPSRCKTPRRRFSTSRPTRPSEQQRR